MTRCAHCTHKLPKRAVVCPYCGFPVPPNAQHKSNAPGNLGPVLAGMIAGLVLVIILGVGALFGYKGGWLDFGPRRSHSVTAVAYRLDDGLPYLSLYIGRPDEHTFDLPAGVYYIEAFDQAGQGVSLGRVTVKAEDGVSVTSVFPRDYSKSSQLLSAQETAQVQTLAEFLLLVDYTRLTYIEIISNGFTTTPYGGDEDIPMNALEPMEVLLEEMAQTDKAVTEAAQVFQARALATSASFPAKATLSARCWFNVGDKLRSFFGLYNKNAESARNEIMMVYDTLQPDQRAESFEMVDPVNRGGAQTYDEFVQKIKNGEISDNTALSARRQFHGAPFYQETVQNAVPGMNRPHINIAHQEGGAAVTAGAELYVEIIKTVLNARFQGIKNGMDYVEKADKWSNYVRDLFSDPTKAVENFTTDQIKDYLSEQIKVDLGEINPGLDDDEIEEIAGALADRITQQAVADVKAGGVVVDAVTGLIKIQPGDPEETEPVEETEPSEPDLSWIPGYVNGVASTLKDQGLRNAAIDAIKTELRDCLEAEVKYGATQEEAISICQYIQNEIEEPTATPEPTTEEVRNFSGSWFGGGACDEGDDPAYRWNVSLAQDASGHVSGTISFHACPGGGAVFYSVSGQATSDSVLVLQGSKTGGRGGLGSSTPASLQFSIKYKKAPNPNYGG